MANFYHILRWVTFRLASLYLTWNDPALTLSLFKPESLALSVPIYTGYKNTTGYHQKMVGFGQNISATMTTNTTSKTVASSTSAVTAVS